MSPKVYGLIVLTGALICGAGAAEEAAVNAPNVTFTVDEKTVPLNLDVAAEIEADLIRYVRSCPLNSVDLPMQLWADEPGWDELSQGAHLIVSYATPLVLGIPSMRPDTKGLVDSAASISQVMLPFPADRFGALPISRHNEIERLFSDCDGVVSLTIACRPEVVGHLPAVYQRYCKRYEK